MAAEVAATGERRRIGRYEIVSEVGRGGMGIVYRAEDPRIGRDVAIKTLTEGTPELRERFYVEARSGILSHPNIVTVYELGEDDAGIPFIAMEFLPGDSLERLLHARKRLPLLEALPITEQLCAGLGYAHQHGLVHRDVKPANVMVLPDARVKIVDFGIARLTDQATRLTRADALLGTFHYIAPERLKGEPSDGRADIWSVGVMLYEMITGELPFRGKDVSTLYRVMHEPFVPLQDLVENLPDGLTGILDRALAKQLDARYSSADEMLVDLQKVTDSLKQGRVEELLESAGRLREERRFANARTLILQVQRLDPGNSVARQLLGEVQNELSHLQRGEQLRQVVEQAEEATTARQWDEALNLYAQAARLDLESSFGIPERIEAVRAAQEQARRVRSLWEQASEARSRGDLTRAQALLGEALEIDDKSTELRQAHSILLREIRRKEDAGRVEVLLRDAREEIVARRYTEALARLREAADVDPTHEEVQQLLLSTTARQREERRRLALEQVVGEIQESLDAEDLERAQDRVTRALSTLPTETALLRLKAEVDRRQREVEVEALVRSAVLEAQTVWDEQPAQALSILDAALGKAPGEPRLTQCRARLEEHQQQRAKELAREARLTRARRWLEQERPSEAILELEAGLVAGDNSPELTDLLTLARERQAALEQRRERDAQLSTARQLHAEGRYTEVLQHLRSQTGDAELDDVRSSAERRLREIADRTEAVTARAAGLAKTDLAGALRLLGEQPDEVKRSPSVVALCAELTKLDTRRQTVAAAAERGQALLRDGDLAGSTRALERLAGELGAQDADLLAARASLEQQRRSVADNGVQTAVRRAHDALGRSAPGDALRELRLARKSAAFASPGPQQELEQLTRRAEGERLQARAARTDAWSRGARSLAHNASSRISSTARRGSQLATGPRRSAAAIALVSVVLAAAGVTTVLRHHAHHAAQPETAAVAPPVAAPAAPAPPAQPLAAPPTGPLAQPAENQNTGASGAPPPSAPTTFLQVSASPWATVVAVKTEDGTSVPLPGNGDDQTTPLRLEGVAAGPYQVTLRSPAGEQKQVRCNVSAAEHLCTIAFGAPNLRQLLKGAAQ